MWWLVPTVALVIFILGLLISLRMERFEAIRGTVIMLALIISFVTGIVAPFTYFEGRETSWGLENYYEAVIEPNIIDEDGEWVTVTNFEAAVWQSGDNNIYSYNQQLKSMRYWKKVPVIGTWIYPLPEHLKYVRVSQ